MDEYALEDVVKFGKFKGLTIYEILQTDVTWITWAIENIDGFELDTIANSIYLEYLDEYRSTGTKKNFKSKQ